MNISKKLSIMELFLVWSQNNEPSFSDNLRYGIKFAKKFIDAPDKRLLKKTGEIRNLMNLHNNEAGRRVGFTYFNYVYLKQIFT